MKGMAPLRAIAWTLALSASLQGCHAAGKSIKTVKLGDDVILRVDTDDWQMEVAHRDGTAAKVRTSASPRGRLGYGLWVGTDITDQIYEGYSWRAGVVVDWWHATKIKSFEQVNGHTAKFRLATSDPFGGVIDLVAQAHPLDPHVVTLHIKAHGGAASRANRLGMAFEGDPDEGYFGFGERFIGSTNNKGKDLYCWTEDGGWVFGSRARLPKERSTYAPIPFMVSSKGYGVFVNTTYRSDWRMDSLGLRKDLGLRDDMNTSAFGFEVETMQTTVAVILGSTPAETLSLFTGPAFFPSRSLVPPKYQFGPWNQFGGEFNDSGYVESVQRFANMDIPSSVSIDPLHFFPMGDDRGQQAYFLGVNAAVRTFGVVPLAYFNSMLDQRFTPDYQLCAKEGYFLKLDDGSIYTFIYKGAGANPFRASLLDFTNPKAVEWYQAKMQKALDYGFGGFMYDYGEYVSPNARAFDNTRGAELHNAYPLQYQKAAFDFFKTKDTNPDDEFAPDYIYYVRSGYSGSQSVIWAHWTGDPYSGWDTDSGLGAQIKAQLSLGISGVPFSGSDIGGFVWEDPPTPELWIRWTQVGAFSGMMHTQMGGTPLKREAKTHIHDTPEGTFIYRKYAKLRTCLFPYMYTSAMEAHANGMPLMRHHILSFPRDPRSWAEGDYQFLFGPSLLVAPIVHPGVTTTSVYLPAYNDNNTGYWVDVSTRLAYDALDGRFRIASSPLVEGGQSQNAQAPLATVPCFVKAGSIIVTIDPTVDTLNPAQDKGVTSYYARKALLHLWVWPDDKGEATSGKQWDGALFTLTTSDGGDGEGAGLLFKAEDPVDGGRILILQVSMGSHSAVDVVKGVTDAATGADVAKVLSWKELVVVPPPGKEDDVVLSGYAVDEEQGTLWVRMPPSIRQVRVAMGGGKGAAAPAPPAAGNGAGRLRN